MSAFDQYLDGLITGLGAATIVFGFATNRWWLSVAVFALIAYYNVRVWSR